MRDSFFRISKKDEEREKAFAENGSKLLEKLIASWNGKPIPIRSFSTQEAIVNIRHGIGTRVLLKDKLFLLCD